MTSPPTGEADRTGDGEEFVLAIDLGTGGPKVAVVSTTGRVVGSGTAPVALHLLPGGGAEQDPDEWWSAIVSSAADARAASGIAPDRIIGVGATSQ